MCTICVHICIFVRLQYVYDFDSMRTIDSDVSFKMDPGVDPRVERWRRAVHAALTLPPIDEAGVPVRVNVGPAHVRGFPQYVEEARRKPLFISESLRDARGGLLLRDGDGRIISLNDDRLGLVPKLFRKATRTVWEDFGMDDNIQVSPVHPSYFSGVQKFLY